MDSILKSDVFFFVTTICVFIVTSLLVMILIEAWRVFKNVRKISDRITDGAMDLSKDLAAFRTMLHEHQFGFKPIIDVMKKTAASFSKSKPKRARKKKAPKEESEFI
ncbi:MAG: hypothetical protein WCT49_00675 [Candidatus Paceibacterota bacterium]|jgi:hypothetical protein|nr:hypothetical protein [Candidatus Paceibacterota bacterium]